MAKKAAKAKARAKKKTGKKKAAGKKKSAKKLAPVKKAKRIAKKPRGRIPVAEIAMGTPAAPSAIAPQAAPQPAALADPKNMAVNSCVNAQMDAAPHPGWNDSGQMDTDYNYNEFSMGAFLSLVKACLAKKKYNAGKGYSLDMNNPAFIKACVTSTVYALKGRVYARTT